MAKSYEELLAENKGLRSSLDESQELLRAIQSGEVDALVLSGSEGDQVFTLEGADHAYRVLIEAMNDGAVTIASDGTVLYCNHHFADMAKFSIEKVIGSSIYNFIPKSDQPAFNLLLKRLNRGELTIQAEDESIIPVYVSVSSLQLSESQKAFCIVFTDLTEQKRNEDIVAAEKLARSIIEQSIEAIIVCDAKGIIIRFSETASHILGYDPSLKDFEDAFKLYLPHGKKFYPASAALDGKVILKSESEFVRDDGRTFHLFINAGPLKNVEDKIIGCVITLSDITERKLMEESLHEKQEALAAQAEELAAQAEELESQNEELRANNEELAESTRMLQESEARFRSVLDNSRDVIYRINVQTGRYEYISPSCENSVGFSCDELMSQNAEKALDMIHPDDRPAMLAAIERLEETDIAEVEYRQQSKEGGYRWLSNRMSLTRDSTGQPLYMNGNIRDFTERKKAEEALRESEERAKLAEANEAERQRLFGVLETLPAMICLLTQDYHVAFASRSFIEKFGESNGRRCYEYCFGRTEPCEFCQSYSVLKTGQPHHWEVTYPDGSVIDAYGFPFTDVDGSPMILEMDIDITEHRQAQAELQMEISEHERTERKLMAAKEAAEAAVEAKAAFLANMSHELRTPLNAVIGFSSLLLDDNLTEDQKENIERIRSGGEALLSIISDILEFSKAEKEKIKLELQPFSLKRCLEESMDMVAVQASEKGLNMAYTISYGTPDTLMGDPGRLRQILANLLSNAVKFTDVGDISASVSSETIAGNKRQITFTVKDTGIGIPQNKMDRLFQPFGQVEYALSRKRDGTGLGLALCKKYVELMGGEIWAESYEGRGSAFKFTIQAETVPGKLPDLVDKNNTKYENLSAQKPLAILVAEDNPSNQKVLVEMLKRLGYRADAVADGVEVLQALQIRPYDLIFMDIKMPEMDGLTATKEIRKLWPENGPKVIAITAFAMDSDREMCFGAGMDDYIAKPVKVDDLAALLRDIASTNKI